MVSILRLLHQIVDELSQRTISKYLSPSGGGRKLTTAIERFGKTMLKQENYARSLSNARSALKTQIERFENVKGHCVDAAMLDARNRTMALQQEGVISRQESMATRLENRYLHDQTAQQVAALTRRSSIMSQEFSTVISQARQFLSEEGKAIIEATLQDMVPRLLEGSPRYDRGIGDGQLAITLDSNVCLCLLSDCSTRRL
jgi:hypothetical protein